MISEKNFTFIWYVLECLTGTCIGFAIYSANAVIGAWCLFSIVLVIAPDRSDALLLASNRIKANLVGASVGLILLYFHPFNIFMICFGILTTMVICEILKLQAAARSAIIAVLIIAMHEPGPRFWEIALDRAAGVILGCLIGVFLTYLFHSTRLRVRSLFAKFIRH